MKLKKRKKSKKMHGKGMGSHGWGARKKHKGSGHRGGFGMAGTGKRADHNKFYVITKFDNKYFGKQGFTSRSTEKKKNKVMNLRDIVKNLESLKKKFGDKEGVLNLKDYKILGEGELTEKIKIKTKNISASAKEKIEKAGGTIIIIKKEEVNKKKEN